MLPTFLLCSRSFFSAFTRSFVGMRFERFLNHFLAPAIVSLTLYDSTHVTHVRVVFKLLFLFTWLTT